MSAPVLLDISPGIVKSTSNLGAKGRWVDGDHVRFVNGRAEKIGGWALYIAAQLDGMARGAYGWTTSANIDLLAFGTYRRIYSVSTELQDITPVMSSGTLNAPFTTTNASHVVSVHDVAHGLDEGAIVTFSGATAVGGLTVDGEYVVLTVTDADNYTITHASAATSGAGPGGGASVAFSYALNPGEVDTTYGLGWGAGGWGEGTWDTPRDASSLALEMRFWSICNYGSELLVNPSGGTIYLWDQPSNDDRAVALAGAPDVVRYTFVTAERYIVALGTTSPMTMSWPDVNDPTDWVPSEDNTANERTLQDGNKLIAGTVFNDAVNLVWSDNAIILMQYLPGSDEIYDTPVIKTSAGLVGCAAFCVTPIGVLWMSGADILLYDGSVQRAPGFGDVRDWFFRRFRRDKAHKVVLTYNAQKNEVQVHYASTGAAENDSYLFLSLDTMSWAPGTMDGAGAWGETAIAVRRNPTKDIYAAHNDGYIYKHEEGTDADDEALPAYIESGLLGLGDGSMDMDVIGYQPDFERQEGDITLDVKLYERPRKKDLAQPVDSGSFTIAETDDLVDMLLGGRFATHRLTSDVLGGDFRLGVGAVEIGQAGSSR